MKWIKLECRQQPLIAAEHVVSLEPVNGGDMTRVHMSNGLAYLIDCTMDVLLMEMESTETKMETINERKKGKTTKADMQRTEDEQNSVSRAKKPSRGNETKTNQNSPG